MGRRQDVDQNQDEADVDNRSSTQTRTRTFSSETCGLAGIVYTSETSLTTNSERSSRSRRPRLTRKGSSGSYSVEERHTRPAQPLSNGNNHTGGASTGDSDSVESSMNEIDGVSTLDLVLRKRYSPSESHQMQHLEPARLEASRGILLDDAALKYLIDRGGHSSIACQRIMGGPSSEPDHSRSNRTMISSCSTVPDPPSLRQGSHYTVPGAFRIVFGGRSSSTNEDAESFVVSISSNINTGMASYDEAPAMVEASLVNDETFHDEECPPSSALSYCGVSMGERTLRTAATYHSTNATTIESPIVEALPIEGSPTVKECLRSRKMQYCLLHMIFLFSVLILGAAYGVRDYTNETPSLSYNATFQSDAPTSAPTSQGDMDLNYFIKVAVPSHTRLALREENSPQSKALKWLRNNTFLASYDIPRRLQRFALATFFFSTGGTREWKNKAGWLSDDDECTWFLSTSQYQDDNMEPCEMNVITRLSLAENKMKGTLPLEISLLNSLEVLEMRKNVLSGFLPTTLGEMNLLRVVDLFDNFLSGTVPPEIGNARSLEVLDIEYNVLRQILPETLSMLSRLKKLVLDRNAVRGSIPVEFGQLSQLETFYMFLNSLSGTIPPELGNLSNLTNVRLGANQLSGTIPSEIGRWRNLQDLSMGNNTLSGPIPSEIGNLSHLTYLDMFDNLLSGTIPSEIGRLTNIDQVYVEQNQLEGSVPTEIGNLETLRHLWLHTNNLTGTLPSEIGRLRELTNLNISYNDLSGELPTELGLLTNLESLSLEGNDFIGSIPSELGLLSKLRLLMLHENRFTGLVPHEICLLVLFESLRVVVDCTRVTCLCCRCG